MDRSTLGYTAESTILKSRLLCVFAPYDWLSLQRSSLWSIYPCSLPADASEHEILDHEGSSQPINPCSAPLLTTVGPTVLSWYCVHCTYYDFLDHKVQGQAYRHAVQIICSSYQQDVFYKYAQDTEWNFTSCQMVYRDSGTVNVRYSTVPIIPSRNRNRYTGKERTLSSESIITSVQKSDIIFMQLFWRTC